MALGEVKYNTIQIGSINFNTIFQGFHMNYKVSNNSKGVFRKPLKMANTLFKIGSIIKDECADISALWGDFCYY